MTPHPESSAKWRIALLATTITMGVALAVSGITGYLQARDAAITVAEVEVMGMLKGLRREIARSRGQLGDAVTAWMAEADEDDGGLHYTAFLDADGAVTASFGTAKLPSFDPGMLDGLRRRPHRRGPSHPARPIIRYADGGLVQGALAMPRRMRDRKWDGETVPPAFIAFEATSVEGPRMVATALSSLIVALSAALLLVAASTLFWRQTRLAEAAARAMARERLEMLTELERDKRLKAMGQMSAVLGHELKNPIAALKGHAQLLLEKLPVGTAGREQAETVVTEAKLLETLTSQVLEFVRTGELSRAKVYLDDLAHGAVALANIDNIEVTVPDDVTWQLDRNRMQEALVNLLVNARQASPSGASIDLILEHGADRLTIAVRDRGHGIPRGEEAQIFEPFHTHKTRGTGLGLAVVKRIVEAHGGTIAARNHPEGGTIMTLTLPRASDTSSGETHV